ncbi:MAG: hypothetical protein JKX73_10075 [Flavobacteriales bacterium]|nr:hypothetical protein [Flavobacteriales bacterium]
MRVVYLGNIGSPIIDFLRSFDDEVTVTSQHLNTSFLNEHQPEFIVSSGYAHLVPREAIDYVNGNIVNLHISYLPWNRGSDPDFWSLVDDTRKGVTIHYIDATFDTGDIIVQEEVVLEDGDTLSSYGRRLHSHIAHLFEQNWAAIKSGTCPRSAQREGGSYHRSVDKAAYVHLLSKGADTPITELLNSRD